MQACLAYNVILNVLTVIVISILMGSPSDRTEVISEGLGINPGCLGRFSNICEVYSGSLGLEDDIQ
jgi:hypothetical protein